MALQRGAALLLVALSAVALACTLQVAAEAYYGDFEAEDALDYLVDDYDLAEADAFDSSEWGDVEEDLDADSEAWEGDDPAPKKKPSLKRSRSKSGSSGLLKRTRSSGSLKRTKSSKGLTKTKARSGKKLAGTTKLGRDKCVLPRLGATSSGRNGYTELDGSQNAYSKGTPCGNIFRKSFNGCGPEAMQAATDFFQSVGPTAKWTGRLEAACNAHDICYSCGEPGKRGQVHCDATMAKNTATLCSTLFGEGKDPVRVKKCVTWAKRFHLLVAKFGGTTSYAPGQCHASWTEYGQKPFKVVE